MPVPSPTARLRRTLSRGLVAGVLVLVAGCGDDDGGDSARERGAEATESGSPATATSSPSVSASESPTASDCPGFCDSFDDPASGWKEESTAGYVTSYDDAEGGAFRVLTRENSSHAATAPTTVSSLSEDYSVTVDVDTRTAAGMPEAGAYGITCWNHPTQDEAGDSAFLLYVDAQTAILGLWDEISAAYVPIAEKPLSGELKPGETNHLTATCARVRKSGRPEARLALSVNGTEVVTGTHTGTAEHPWDVGDGVGLVTAGAGADVRYDDFEVTPG
ncbi:MAG: hypothetical protein ABWX84_14715 [Nocardioides sp.]